MMKTGKEMALNMRWKKHEQEDEEGEGEEKKRHRVLVIAYSEHIVRRGLRMQREAPFSCRGLWLDRRIFVLEA